MRIGITVFGITLGVLAILGCQEKQEGDLPNPMGLASVRADEPTQQWGTIKGQVVWGEKDLPAVAKLEINKDVEVCKKNGDVVSEKYVVDPKTKGVANVFVWLAAAKAPNTKKGEKWAAIPIHPSLKKSKEPTVTLDQPCCQFVPHALALRDDQTLVIKNSAAVAHNVHLTGNNNYGLNKIMPPGAEAMKEMVPASAELVSVQCDIHGWMKAYLHVFDHPYFMVTGPDGKFEIKNVPAGEYRILMWQDEGWIAFDNADAPGKNGKLIKIKPDSAGVTDLGTFKVMKSTD